jgi:hypothetical protein
MDRTYVRRLGLPREVAVSTDTSDRPVVVAGRPVEHLRDQWRVEEGWWTRQPVRRVYFDLVLAGGRQTVVFCDRRRGRWYAQRT